MNVLAWSAVAVAVALVVHQAFVHAVVRYVRWNMFGFSLNERPDSFITTTWFELPRFIAKGVCDVIAGFAVGGIIGSKVWKHQPWVAAAAAAAYSLVVVFLLESWARLFGDSGPAVLQRGLGGSGWSAVLYDLVGIVAILTAALWARHIARRHA
jgi:hypothetical protein